MNNSYQNSDLSFSLSPQNCLLLPVHVMKQLPSEEWRIAIGP
jgi:hypothetical protein